MFVKKFNYGQNRSIKGVHKLMGQKTKESFFTKDKTFYRTLFPLLITVALQNIVAYSVNMADNIMLGSYSQNALSGAATVNQIFFMVQQITLGIGEGLVVLGAQYWGQQRMQPIRKLTGIALKLGLICGIITILICTFLPHQVVSIFTNDTEIIAEGVSYLGIIKYTFLLFIITNVLMAALRCVETVKISFYISIVSLFVNVGINYVLIFGRFGAPELGIRGAAIGTLIARIVELAIVVIYMLKVDKKLNLFSENFMKFDAALRQDYTKVEIPVMLSQVLWAISVPFQTAILGHLSSDAIAANSVATTFYQYLKVIVVAMSSSSAVMIGSAVGRGDMKRIKSDARTLAVIDLLIGAALGLALFLLRKPLLTLYNLNDTALVMADQLIIVMSFIMVGMSYQMPTNGGIIRGSGSIAYSMKVDLISTWGIVIPLSMFMAFVVKASPAVVVCCLNADQIFKCVPAFLKCNYGHWIKNMTN